jgi:predicted nucleic acid-binding protein
MKFVIDSNVLFTFFWKGSFTRKLFLNQDLELISPELSLKEINKYSEYIMGKTKLSSSNFEKIKRELGILVKFISMDEYSGYLKKALKISPDKNDVDFFALALKNKCPIWSNDKLLKKQTVVNVFSTFDMLKVFDE